MKFLTTKPFAKWFHSERISEKDLIQAVQNIENGLSVADLGAGLFKVRIARKGGGKSGGFRVIVVLKLRDRAIFIHGFAKSENDNISKKELSDFKELASTLLKLTIEQIKHAVDVGALKEIQGDKK